MTPLFDYKDNYAEFRHVRSIMQYGDFSRCPSPKISVFIPVYNSPEYFKDAINSVLNQDCDFSYEVIVVDNTPYDGKKNETLIYIENLGPNNVFYYRNEINIGMCGNWNRAIELCRADYITMCHDDDMLMPSCLSILWEMHKKYVDKVLFPAHKVINERYHYLQDTNIVSVGRRKKIKCYLYNKLDMFVENPSNGVGCLFNRTVLLELGGYNNEYFPALDYALYIKYVFKYGGVFCLIPLYCYRKAEGNTSFSVYEQYPPIMNYLWDNMIEEIRLPRAISRRIKNALMKNFKNALDVVWRGKQPSISFGRFDKLLFFLLYKRKKIKIILGI